MKPHMQNDQAERQVLAAMLQSAPAIVAATEFVGPEDFAVPVHGRLFLTLVSMMSADEPVTEVTLDAWLARDGHSGDMRAARQLMLVASPADALEAHCRVVWECSARRRLEETARSIHRMADDPGETVADVLDAAAKVLELMASHTVPGDSAVVLLEEFMAQRRSGSETVIPGLLNDEDRVVIVGNEGDGKTILGYQVAIGKAAGVHPFAWEPIEPGRVMIVDLENPRGIMQQNLGDFIAVASHSPRWSMANVAIVARPGGLNLDQAADAFRLAEMIRRFRPRLIVGGPVYKMFTESENDRERHAAICRFFDKIRERYHCAVWLETHAPISVAGGARLLRPMGSGIWSRWPEFGIALERQKNVRPRTVALSRFRGDRVSGRVWPEKLQQNDLNPRPRWPWSAIYPAGTLGLADVEAPHLHAVTS